MKIFKVIIFILCSLELSAQNNSNSEFYFPKIEFGKHKIIINDTIIYASLINKSFSIEIIKQENKTGTISFHTNNALYISRKRKSPYSWDIYKDTLFALAGDQFGSAIKYCPIDSLFLRKKFDYDKLKNNPSISKDSLGKMIIKSASEQAMKIISGLNPINQQSFSQKKKYAHWDFVISGEEQFNDTLKLTHVDFFVNWSNTFFWYRDKVKKINNRFLPLGNSLGYFRLIEKYNTPYLRDFQVFAQNNNTFLLTDTVIYKIKPDTVLRTGKIIKDTLQQETIVSNFFIDDKDNKEIQLFPPYYFVKENDEAPKIRTLKPEEETYKLTMKMAEMYFKEEDK